MRTKQIQDEGLFSKEEKSQALFKTKTAQFVEEQIEQKKKKTATDVIGILERHDQGLQSPPSKVAQWVGELAWYQHLMLLMVVVAAAATLGIFLNAIAICAITAGVLYLVTAGLLKLHHYYDQRRLNSMTEMAAYAQERLHEGIQNVAEIGIDLENLALGLKEASNTMEGYGQDFAEQAQRQQEQTQATEGMNQQLHQIHEALEETQVTMDQTNEHLGETWESLHRKLVENVAHLDNTEKALTQSALVIEQSAASSVAIHEELAQGVDTFVGLVDNLKENASVGLSLIERLEQSSLRVLESTKETDQANKELQDVLEKTAEENVRRDEVIKGFAENRKLAQEDRKLAKEDRKRHEKTMTELEENERQFQEEFARVMHHNERAPTPAQPAYR